jgi:hypothetical protein
VNDHSEVFFSVFCKILRVLLIYLIFLSFSRTKKFNIKLCSRTASIHWLRNMISYPTFNLSNDTLQTACVYICRCLHSIHFTCSCLCSCLFLSLPFSQYIQNQNWIHWHGFKLNLFESVYLHTFKDVHVSLCLYEFYVNAAWMDIYQMIFTLSF